MLRKRQQAALAAIGVAPAWHGDVGDVPEGPTIVIANEFFDALPVHQFVRTPRGWCERLVGLAPEGALAFGLAAEPTPGLSLAAPEGTVLEVAAASAQVMAAFAARLAAQGGAMLAIDYGHDGAGVGDTLQAVRRHAFVDPLAEPGDADLTVHVDFRAWRARPPARERSSMARSRRARSSTRSASRSARMRWRGVAMPPPSKPHDDASLRREKAAWARSSRSWRSPRPASPSSRV